MKIKFLFLFLIIVIGCNSNNVSEPEKFMISFQEDILPVHNYSQRYFFINNVYADTSANLNIFHKRYNGVKRIIDDSISYYKVKRIQVWKGYSFDGMINGDIKSRVSANCFFDLPPRKYGDLFDDSLRQIKYYDTWEKTGESRMYLLDEGVDYIIDRLAGIISFSDPIQIDEMIALAYSIDCSNPWQTYDDLVYGELLDEFVMNNYKSRIVLKLLIPKGYNSSSWKSWDLQLKNVYSIPYKTNDYFGDDIEIALQYLTQNGEYLENYNNTNLLRLFGFDNYTRDTMQISDNRFDFEGRHSFRSFNGYSDLIFPVLYPFGNQLPSEFPTEDRIEEIYQIDKNILRSMIDKSKFNLKIKYKLVYELD